MPTEILIRCPFHGTIFQHIKRCHQYSMNLYPNIRKNKSYCLFVYLIFMYFNCSFIKFGQPFSSSLSLYFQYIEEISCVVHRFLHIRMISKLLYQHTYNRIHTEIDTRYKTNVYACVHAHTKQ